jgi:transcriptional regulator with XRE-family HTH domain
VRRDDDAALNFLAARGAYAGREIAPRAVSVADRRTYRERMSQVASIGPGGHRHAPLLRTLVGDVLRRRRIAQRRTLADVARAARVSLPYLSEVERGRKEASSEVLAAVCEALGLALADFLTEVRLQLVATRPVPAHRHHHISPPAGRISPPAHRPGDAVLLAA